MKGKIIEVQVFNDSTTLYMCCSENTDNKYFICLENTDFVEKYIRISKNDFNNKNKKNNYANCYKATDQHEALFEIRRDIEHKMKP